MAKDPWKPLLNRAIMGTYPPGSTFKTAQALTFSSGRDYRPVYNLCVQQRIQFPRTARGMPRTPLSAPADSRHSHIMQRLFLLGTLSHDRRKKAIRLRAEGHEHLARLYGINGIRIHTRIDLPGEKRGFIPNASVYDKAYRGSWNGLTIISIAIGQGEVTLTPLQIANLGATIANRGYFITPHVVKRN